MTGDRHRRSRNRKTPQRAGLPGQIAANDELLVTTWQLGSSQVIDQRLLEGAYSTAVAISFSRRLANRTSPCGPLPRLAAFLRPTDGDLQIWVAGRGDPLGHTDLSQQARRKT